MEFRRVLFRSLDDRTIQIVYACCDFRCRAAGYLPDFCQRVDLITGVDALGGVSYKEVFVKREAGDVFKYRNADLFCTAGVTRRLVDDDIDRTSGVWGKSV